MKWIGLLLLCGVVVLLPAHRSMACGVTRERIGINENWRFHMGDPENDSTGLIYDVRPEAEDSDYTVADAEPTTAKALEHASTAILKPWILPSGNRFIKDAAKRYVRPEAVPPCEGTLFAQIDFDDGEWAEVNLPHDWAIAGPFLTEGPYGGMGRLRSWGIGWYRKALDIPASDAGRSIFLDVDGAMSYASVWLNGKLVGGWPYGYASWRLDLTPYVDFGGENQLAIRLDNPPNSSRWYPGGGIYRNVWLVKTLPVHVAQWGTFVTSRNVSGASATVDLETTVDNDSEEDVKVKVRSRIYAMDSAGHRTCGAVASVKPVLLSVPAGSNAVVKGSVIVENPQLWGPSPQQSPNRYVAVTQVRQDGRGAGSI